MNNNFTNILIFFVIILLKCPKKFQIKETQKNPNQRDKKQNRVFLSKAQKIPIKLINEHHILIFLSLLSSDLSMSSSVSAASLNLSFYFHVPLLSQPCLSFSIFLSLLTSLSPISIPS